MRLDFSVLWFDDNEDYFDSLDIDALEDDISSWGFVPIIDKVTTPEKFNAESPFERYDLIVVDRTLEGYKDGEEFIADIRSHAIFTEIIFYTAGNASELWDSIRVKELEGVFVSSRPNILSKIAKVGYQSIRKVLDLENMRGIVMAEVGELDHLLGEILSLGINGLTGDQQGDIFKRFYGKLKDQQACNDQRLEKFIATPEIDTMLTFCDSNKRWENFIRLRKRDARLQKNNSLGDYVIEILHPRNFLAHGKPLKMEDGSFSFSFQGKKFAFDNDASRSLRQKILKYKTDFSDIVALLKDG